MPFSSRKKNSLTGFPLARRITLLYVSYSCLSIGYEMYALAKQVDSFDLTTSYPDMTSVTGWDRYQITYYLWAQSSVGSTVASFLYSAVMLMSYEAEEDSLRDSDQHGETVMEQDDRYIMRMLIVVCFLIPFMPIMLTHIFPMGVIYCYFVVGICMASGIFSYFLFVSTNSMAYCYNRWHSQEGSDDGNGMGHVDLDLHVVSMAQTAASSGGSTTTTTTTGSKLRVSDRLTGYLPIFWYIIFVFVFQTMITYAILIYGRGGGSYVDNIILEFNTRKTKTWFDCLAKGRSLTLFDTVRAWF